MVLREQYRYIQDMLGQGLLNHKEVHCRQVGEAIVLSTSIGRQGYYSLDHLVGEVLMDTNVAVITVPSNPDFLNHDLYFVLLVL